MNYDKAVILLQCENVTDKVPANSLKESYDQ